MAPKQQLDKLAWQWAETTDPADVRQEHIDSAYRVHLKACKRSTCRRNCRGNPNCQNGLGEREWFLEIDDNAWHDIEDPETERRQEGAFVGLKNLGATCYVNTFIQVWFHNPVFRNAIYAWRGEVGALPSTSHNGDGVSPAMNPEPVFGPAPKPTTLEMAEDKELMPTTVCGHLQLIFGLLQFSNRRYIDPSSFIHCLGLDTGQQQDAQEFSKLFMSVLEDQLSQAVPSLSPSLCSSSSANLIQDQFKGEYAYVTTCSACSGGSQRPSDFYELDLNIKGHSNLNECIEEFLQEEKLENDNQYMCGSCNRKQNASRRIRLKRLPNVLNLQLLRFVFDRKSGHKKKLNTFIQFPEVLDLSEHVGQEAESCVYTLTAVLIHRGPSAYSGHYVAHIKDTASQSWYKFNDEEIQKMEGKKLQLGNEEDLGQSLGIEGKGPKKPKTTKGYHCSRNAYMLVYVRQGENTEPPKPMTMEMLPERLQLYIEMDKRSFEDWVVEMKTMRDSNVCKGKERQQEIQHIVEMMHVKPGEAYEWIDSGWLSKWLSENAAAGVPPIDNASLCCPHGKINPDRISKFKIISAAAAEILFAKYSGGPRLKGPEMMCRTCVVERCRVIRTKARVAEDQKVITAALKANPDPCEDSFWVGKASLRSWRRLAVEKMEDEEPKNGDTNTEVSENAPPEGKMEKAVEEDPVQLDEPENSRLGFNEDILCEQHKALVVEEGCRRLVLGDVWRRLRAYFPEAPEFKYGTETCLQCRREAEEAEAALRLAKTTAQEQKVALADLYSDKNRPLWGSNTNVINLVPKDFVDAWRKFIKEPHRHPQVKTLSNSSFLCPHGGFMHDPETAGLTGSSDSVVYIWPKEWTELQRIMETDVEVILQRVVEESGHITVISTPDVCVECQSGRREAERQAQFSYSDAIIFVRKVTPDNKAAALSGGPPVDVPPGEGPENSTKDDPEFSQPQVNGKRKKLEPQVTCPEKAARMETTSCARRSSRHRRMRGEKELTVSAATKLWDLKIMLMREFSTPPMDQHLYLCGTQLTGDQRTLGELGVAPCSVLYLQIDEPCDDPLLLDDVAKAARPEEGFKGTGLLGGALTT